jgi:hypothetical protein
MKVRYLKVRSLLNNGKILSSFREGRGISLNLDYIHELHNYIDNNSYSFYLLDITKNPVSLTGQFKMTLEFTNLA